MLLIIRIFTTVEVFTFSGGVGGNNISATTVMYCVGGVGGRRGNDNVP